MLQNSKFFTDGTNNDGEHSKKGRAREIAAINRKLDATKF
jgi:hypothetical protein